MNIINPANQKLILSIDDDSKAGIHELFLKARKAQQTWRHVSFAEKSAMMRKFSDLLIENIQRLALVLTRETGKPVKQAVNEINAVTKRIDYFINKTPEVMKSEMVFSDKGVSELLSYEPLGVIGCISAWNYPYFVGLNILIPALLTGNAVLYKPSEISTLTGIEIVKLLLKSGIPEDVIACIHGAAEQGRFLLDEDIDGLFFTGSYATGKKISETLAGRFIRTQFELGGKDPAYVTDDVNVRVAAESLAEGVFYNNGQSCCAVERIYVQESIADEFIDIFLNTVKSYNKGNPELENTFLGPLARNAQLQLLNYQIEDALQKGGRLVLGGPETDLKQNYFTATVLTNVNHKMEIMKEENFGPLIGIQKVASDAEAADLMLDTEYGLTSAVYSKSENRAKEILSHMNTGTVYWNACDRVSPHLPWTGRRHSGIGSTLSKSGILAFLQPKAWHLRRMD